MELPRPFLPLYASSSKAASVSGPGPDRVSPSSAGPQELEYMSISSFSNDNASASVLSPDQHAIRVEPPSVASQAAPETYSELFPTAAATPAAAVPCPFQEFGAGSLSSLHQS